MANNEKNRKVSGVQLSEPPLLDSKRSSAKEPVKRAAAISYDPENNEAPVLSAFGEGSVADKIVAVARESGVPVLPDPSLASMLAKISIGDEIPEDLYEAVAKVLVFVSEVDKGYGERIRRYNSQ